MIDDTQDILYRAYNSLKSQVDFRPKVLLTLGSGLGDIVENMQVVQTINYADIDGMPISTVKGHKGRYLFGYISGVPVAVMQGRVHYYEGYTPQECVLPVRLIGLLGAKIFFATNVSGGITYPEKGTIMRITDHISLIPSPLRGKNIDSLGVRFPGMTRPYDEGLGAIVDSVAKAHNIDLKKGVYIQMQGPNFETASEVRMAKILGADVVGMSTAIEVIAARHMGLKVVGMTCVVNPACGVTDESLDNVVEEDAFRISGDKIKTLIFESIGKMGELSL
ncbi:MAG: purine-nucleoside phosphorylase [Clostridia bacterium]|nr:purine-nucleoside phosphorylase [Clostridia bacterium]